MYQRLIARSVIISALFFVVVNAFAQDSLQKNFQNPPASAKPHTWWHWMNGNITREGITADLEAMAKVGIGGAQIFNVDQGVPAGKTPFMSPQWREAMVHAAKEAKRLRLELCLHNCAGWSSSGGPWIDPAHSMLMLTWTETPTVGGQKVAVALPEPAKREGFYKDICVLAVKQSAAETARIPDIRTKALFERGSGAIPAPGAGQATGGGVNPKQDIVVLSCAADGSFNWDAPAGTWTILRMGYTTTGAVCAPAPAAGRGLECDKLSREAMNLHWSKGIAPILSDMGPELAGKVLNNALIDSYEVGSQNWTPALREEFQKRRGYDLLPWLVTVTGRVVGNPEQSERFLWDFRRTISDLFAENYAGRFKELCHKNGMKFSVEPYGNGTFDNLQIGEQADIPMGEFWIGGLAQETIKIAASSAHVMGRSIVGAESFTADDIRGRWQVEPYGIKTLGDRMFTQGLNRYIFHRYAHQPWIGLNPGMTMGPWGTHFERTVTWWEQSREWLKYIARCQYLLQSGQFVADVLTFSGDDAPNDLFRPELPFGFDYDGCDRTVLMTARVENGEIVLPGGARYRALLLPDSSWMTPETARKIAELSKAGATIVGRKPVKSPSLSGYPACDAAVQSAIANLNLTPPSRLSRILGNPDVRFTTTSSSNATSVPLPWIHRQTKDADIYFVSNPRYINQQARATFRVRGKTPELWHPETGKMGDAPVWSRHGDFTEVTLNLSPAESIFVVFRKQSSADSLIRVELTDAPVSATQENIIVIEKAMYEAVDGSGGADVTEKVRNLVESGEVEIPATNALFGDPALLHVKRLRIQYTLNQKRQDKAVGENETISLTGSTQDSVLPPYEWKDGNLVAYTPGTYVLTGTTGAQRRIVAPAPHEQTLTAPWTLTFPPHLGAPASVTMDKLISWSESPVPGVKYFSGSATYATSFNLSQEMLARDHALILDLGRVKNFAEVTINGKPLPTLWKAPWRVDVTGMAKQGANTLSIRVTNLWVNRLIGDEQLEPEVKWSGATGPIQEWPQWLMDGKPRPATDHIAFSTWRFWGKNDPLLESGLLGPVVLRAAPLVKVR